MSRNYRMDNIKFILIALVVFGHFLELTGNGLSVTIYRIIYSFHMPAFLFITGYFAHYNPKKIFLSFICPYFFFQTLYLVFNTYILHKSQTCTIQFTTPYWLLWYLLVVIFYYLLLPLFQTKNIRSQGLILLITVILSLLSGCNKSIGYYMSLARFFSFLPFFVSGHFFAGHSELLLSKIKTKELTLSRVSRILTLVGIALSIYYVLTADFSKKVLYGSVPYNSETYTPFIKLILILVAFCWIAFLLCFVPNNNIPPLSLIGKNTFSIYLLHGFIIKLANNSQIFKYSETTNILLALLLTLILLYTLGNSIVSNLFHLLFTGGWVEKIYRNNHTKKGHTKK